MMRRLAGHRVLRLLGGLCVVAGLLAWCGLVWRASSDLDRVTPQGEEGGRLMVWALTGTVLMIAGMIILHFAANAAEREERVPPR